MPPGRSGRERGNADLGLELADERRRCRALAGAILAAAGAAVDHCGEVGARRVRLDGRLRNRFHATLPIAPYAPGRRSTSRRGARGTAARGGSADTEVVTELIAAGEPGVVERKPALLRLRDRSALPSFRRSRLARDGWDQNASRWSCLLQPLRWSRWPQDGSPTCWGTGRVASGFVNGAQVRTPLHWPPPGSTSSRPRAGTSNATGSRSAAIRVLAGAERHVTIDRSLGSWDRNGGGRAHSRRQAGANPSRGPRGRDRGAPRPTIVCAQAGTSTRAPATRSRRLQTRAPRQGLAARDGAFGLWAAASPRFATS